MTPVVKTHHVWSKHYFMTQPAPEAAKVFEITIPPGADADLHARQLGRLAAEFGLVLVERLSDPIISPGGLQLLSRNMWDSPDYGSSAASLLHILQSAVTSHGRVLSRDGLLYVVVPAFELYAGKNGVPLGPTDMSVEEVDRRAHAVLNELESPFPLIATHAPSPYEDERTVRNIVPLAPTQSRLSRFVQSRGYGQHMLHGSIGKALDVLVAAAGITPEPVAASRECPGEFITSQDLRELLRSTNLFTNTQINTLFDKIAHVVKWQLLHGAPLRSGEVVVEGACSYSGAWGSQLEWSLLAVDTVPHIVGAYGGTSAVVDFLPRFSHYYARWKATKAH